MSEPEPEELDPDWKCPQYGCNKPLSEHLVTRAAMDPNVRAMAKIQAPKEPKTR